MTWFQAIYHLSQSKGGIAEGTSVVSDGLSCWSAVTAAGRDHWPTVTGSGRQAARWAPFTSLTERLAFACIHASPHP